mmetsp:Transcript_79937/g.126079  ORF Transcript_79937/g.126079 Transcript_79937/m.126079 type:complete len:306 (-) Transcript_79937:146-1063(-)|eukprot:CAMPEP_0169184632 /NCGR_PEP_ID=MMETSP1016-20121227/1328_1 /TAXON_ID=342587 /ORGANISM="Karlodinium micrum, Strain CCMP2283" /LENGTH=305 /DNA_ID=CAMNT_0009260205 /DNA_START=50 /DNA_END=967 /DNA_ORIENTATION=-
MSKRASGFDGTAEEPAAKKASADSGVAGLPPGFSLDSFLGGQNKSSDAGGLGLYLSSGGSDLGAPKIATSSMDFSRKESPAIPFPISRKIAQQVMTPECRRILEAQSGAEIEWAPDLKQGPHAMMKGSPDQVRLASKLLARVKTHCAWGCNDEKIKRLLKPRTIEKALCRLSPMDSLRPIDKMLSSAQPRLSIGKGKECDAVIQDSMVSRLHCFLELSANKGSVYVTDCSTNGTYLNGVRLPSKKQGKVLLSHGDELLLKEPSSGSAEFGYIVNITEIQVKEEVNLGAPRRLLSPDEAASHGRDL